MDEDNDSDNMVMANNNNDEFTMKSVTLGVCSVGRREDAFRDGVRDMFMDGNNVDDVSEMDRSGWVGDRFKLVASLFLRAVYEMLLLSTTAQPIDNIAHATVYLRMLWRFHHS